MEIAIRKIGNGRGVVLPKPLLAEAGLEERSIAHIAVENGTSVPSKPSKAGGGRSGRRHTAMGEFGNTDDGELDW